MKAAEPESEPAPSPVGWGSSPLSWAFVLVELGFRLPLGRGSPPLGWDFGPLRVGFAPGGTGFVPPELGFRLPLSRGFRSR